MINDIADYIDKCDALKASDSLKNLIVTNNNTVCVVMGKVKELFEINGITDINIRIISAPLYPHAILFVNGKSYTFQFGFNSTTLKMCKVLEKQDMVLKIERIEQLTFENLSVLCKK